MGEDVDVCLVVEGSYPYVTGGVASWVQWLMENLKEFSFGVVALLAARDSVGEKKYRLPSNVAAYKEFFLFEYERFKTKRLFLSRKKKRKLYKGLEELMRDFSRGGFQREA